MMSMPVVRV